MTADPTGAIDRILEIGGNAAGYCGRAFVQTGHAVVRADTGDAAPGFVSDAALDLYLHPGKRRLATRDPGLLRELASRADVIVAEAPDARGMEALGFDDWEAPVKVAITPFGRTGPKRDWQATPSTLLAMGGYSNLMGDADRAPLTLPGHYPEFQAGALAYTAANASRLAGRADTIDIGMLEVLMALHQFTSVLWHCAGEVRSRHGNDYWYVAPTNLFRCVDGWVYINVVPNFWDPFTTFLDRPELVLDERFTSNESRMGHRDALHEIVADVLAMQTTAEVQARADEHRIPCGIVLTLDDVLADAHLEERGVWQDVADERGRTVRAPRPPWHFRGDARQAPVLSETELRAEPDDG